ncbi:MAG: helix-turn-helix transcriptional regulator [Trueperaceae bacterium]|nr:helix-turn-helix transcriptional regulator [Trueperaceae bacterium]
MSQHIPPEDGTFLEWLDQLASSDSEARQAALDEEVHLYLPAALRRAREASGMTQEMVAEASGLRQSAVSRMERTGHNPTMASVMRYVDAVGAELAMNIVVGEQQIPATRSAERTISLPSEILERAAARGLTPRAYVLGCIARDDARQGVAGRP